MLIISNPTIELVDPVSGRAWLLVRTDRSYRIPGVERPINENPQWGDFIEFHDLGPDGGTYTTPQYVSSYYSKSLLDDKYGPNNQGICLQGNVPEWSVSTTVADIARAMARYAMNKASN